jgi:protein involved in polysaccharide export with SLBB domain
VVRPAIYELLENETLATAIGFTGGFKPAAIKDVAKLARYDVRTMSLKDVAASDFETILPKNGDSVHVDKILDIYSNRVVLEGAVYRPGSYELTSNLSVATLLKKADGVIENAFLNRGTIKRNIPGTEPTLLSFDVQKIVSGAALDIMQALARIVVGKQMLAISERYRVALTVHDAAVVVVQEDVVPEAVAYINEVMSTPPDWATNLPVACETKVGATYGDT